MSLEQITRSAVMGDTEYTFVRPGITLCMLYAKSAQALGSAIAGILEDYIDFVPEGALQTYLSASGSWKTATNRTFAATYKQLRSAGPDEYSEFHFGQAPPRNVGKFGAHFYAAPLADTSYPRETSILYLEFPVDVEEFSGREEFLGFVRKVAAKCEFDSGFCGYAFKHLQMSLRGEAFEEIAKMAMRYIGLDVSNDFIRLQARGRVANISWLTLLGEQIATGLGGAAQLRQQLPEVKDVQEVAKGVMIVASEAPILGDVNRGAADVAPLRKLAQITRPMRIEMDNMGPDDPDFADRWLGRFDE